MTGWAGVDWAQAPTWATHWAMDEDGDCYWFGPIFENERRWVTEFKQAKNFGYTGAARDSLTVRPAP